MIVKVTVSFLGLNGGNQLNTFNIRESNYIHESIRFGFPENSDDTIVINYILCAKDIYL